MRDRLRWEHPDARAEVARAPVAHPPDVAAVLRMQALAGNHATSRLLAREPEPATARERTIVLEGVGTFPLLAFRLEGEKGVVVTLEDGPISPRLLEASRNGTAFPSVTIAAGAVTLAMTQVLVSSFQQSGHGGEAPTISVELEGATRELR